MKRLIPALLFVCLMGSQLPGAKGQTYLVNDTLISSFTTTQLVFQGVFLPENGVDVYSIVYNTTDAFGNPTFASGALVIPQKDSCEFPIVNYHHGTVTEREDVPSFASSELFVGLNYSAFGYVSVLPDYLGMGINPAFHPYIISEPTATASIDMMRAAREFCSINNIELNDQVFLTGYSQGGHATLATQQYIESNNLTSEFDLVAVAPLSPPVSLDSIMAETLLDTVPYGAPYFAPYLLFGYDAVYDLYDSVQQVLVPPYDSTLPPLFDGTNSGVTISAAMPLVPRDVFTAEVIDSLENYPNSRFRSLLRQNSVWDWTPQAPVHIWACEADELVPYANSQFAFDQFTANGAADVELNSAGAALDHGTCAIPAILAAKGWFDTLKGPCQDTSNTSVADLEREQLNVYPNPVREEVFVVLPNATSNYDLVIRDLSGRMIRFDNNVAPGTVQISRSGLPAGLYFLEVSGNGMTFINKLIFD